MSKKFKKDKIKKQLLAAQMQAHQRAASQNPHITSTHPTQQVAPKTGEITHSSSDETRVHRRDTFLSVGLIIVIVILFSVLYVMDQKHNVLLPFANRLFTSLVR
ncbi:MAG: hypothetical protein WC045_01465 [Patescibacteria group bacterium]